SGGVDHANSVARALLDRDRLATQRSIADVIRSFEADLPTASSVTRLGVPGGPERWLVVLPEHVRSLDARLADAARTWSITPRQLDVLRRMANGDANKTIAHKLGCSEATVEAHATALFRKAGVDGRTALVAKVLAG